MTLKIKEVHAGIKAIFWHVKC